MRPFSMETALMAFVSSNCIADKERAFSIAFRLLNVDKYCFPICMGSKHEKLF